MLCERCGAHVPDDALTCDSCGTYLAGVRSRTQGMDSLRQGKAPQRIPIAADTRTGSHVYDEKGRVPSREEVPYQIHRGDDRQQRRVRRPEEDAGRPTVKKGLPTHASGARRQVRTQRGKPHHVQKHMINWAHVTIAVVLLVMIAALGAFYYLKETLPGQKIMVRAGQDGSHEAFWQVGEEYLNKGYIDKAIEHFLIAREKELALETPVDNIEGLLLLGSAYEAADRPEEAEALYVDLYNRLVPSRPEAYRSMVRILMAQDRGPEAGELLKLAYEKTGMTTFRMQRDELLPNTPETSLTSGRYSDKRKVVLTSAEGHPIYYTTDPAAVLPGDGVLYTGPIQLEEGTVAMRAVTVNGDLVSDPLSVSYTVIMPSPASPYIRLAPNTYKRRQKVYITPGDENENVTIYYTIDGSTPDADSPIYTGEPVALPTGRVTMKAIAVNEYGKSSHAREVSWKITVSPYPKEEFTQNDTFKDFQLMKTTQEAFENKYGKGRDETLVKVGGFEEACKKYTYDWGYAVYGRAATGVWMVCQVYMNQNISAGPRGTKIGDKLDDVIGQFKDMNQLPSPSGNRGLYQIEDKGRAKLYKLDERTYSLQYRCTTSENDTLDLIYHFTDGVCDSITTALTK